MASGCFFWMTAGVLCVSWMGILSQHSDDPMNPMNMNHTGSNQMGDNSTSVMDHNNPQHSPGNHGNMTHSNHGAMNNITHGNTNATSPSHHSNPQHSSGNHGNTTHSNMNSTGPGNHGQMNHGAHNALNSTEHGNMDGHTNGSHSNMGHNNVGHSTPDQNTDHENTDHGNMDQGNIDHGNMDHGNVDHGNTDHGNVDAGNAHGDHQSASADHSIHLTGHNTYFYAGVSSIILFENWVTNSTSTLIGACIAVAFAGMLYEAMKVGREALLIGWTKRKYEKKRKCLLSDVMHILQSFLHVLQVFYSYTLMLVFMTFNIWLCVALCVGMGIGYFLFHSRRRVEMLSDINEHCN